ncbi:MAG: transcription antitermination protein NusB [bacterium]
MSGRSRSIRPDRRYALLALYQFDSGLAGDLAAVRAALESVDELGDDGEGADLSTAAARLEARDPERIAARREEIEAGLSLASMVWEFRNDADKAVRPFTAEWPVHRQPVIDRNALRLGWYGFTHAGDPVAVAIDESVELAKTFSTEKSGAFVNAVLDRVAKSGASEKAQ